MKFTVFFSYNYLSIYKKVRAVEKVFQALEKDVTSFQLQSGLKCLSACGKCCSKADIEASILEFLPFAYHLYKNDQAFDFLDQLKNSNSAYCLLFRPFLGVDHKGFCSDYKYRGLICRLFGFSGRRDKYGTKNLVTCKVIKTEQEDIFTRVSEDISTEKMEVPMMSDYSMKLYAIDFQLAAKYYPINEAIKLAIETVLSYYSYRTNKAG